MKVDEEFSVSPFFSFHRKDNSMLSTLRYCGTRSLISKETVTVVFCPRSVSEALLRRQFASLVGSKSQNVRKAFGKTRRFFSEEVGVWAAS